MNKTDYYVSIPCVYPLLSDHTVYECNLLSSVVALATQATFT